MPVSAISSSAPPRAIRASYGAAWHPVKISPPPNVRATFTYQATNSGNETIGTLSTPVRIGPGIAQNFVIAFTPTEAIEPTEVQLTFRCGGASEGAAEAPVFVGVNTLLLSASTNPVPVIVALAATAGNNGIVDILGAFAVAGVNVGVAGAITVLADTSGTALLVMIALCQTNPATGVCFAPPGPA